MKLVHNLVTINSSLLWLLTPGKRKYISKRWFGRGACTSKQLKQGQEAFGSTVQRSEEDRARAKGIVRDLIIT